MTLGRANSDHSLKVFAANVTQFGPQAREYIHSTKGEYHVYALSEMHLDDQQVRDEGKRLSECGLVVFGTAARPTGRGGLGGGTAVLVDDALGATQLNDVPGETLDTRDLCNFTPVFLHSAEGRAFLLVSAYFVCGGPGANHALFSQLASWLCLVKCPWAIVGDMNMTPAVFMGTGFAKYFNVGVFTPPNIAATCSSGKGALYDYIVFSPEAEQVLSELRVVPPPFKPHLALAFSISFAPVVKQNLLQKLPRSLPVAKQKARQEGFKERCHPRTG